MLSKSRFKEFVDNVDNPFSWIDLIHFMEDGKPYVFQKTNDFIFKIINLDVQEQINNRKRVEYLFDVVIQNEKYRLSFENGAFKTLSNLLKNIRLNEIEISSVFIRARLYGKYWKFEICKGALK